MTITDDVLAACSLRPGAWPPEPGRCVWCAGQLPKRARRWCAGDCQDEFTRQHGWQMARAAAIRRDGGRCIKCGHDGTVPGEDLSFALLALLSPRLTYEQRRRHLTLVSQQQPLWRLEVNHRDPVLGRHGEFGCHHHLDGLETVCHPCHLDITAEQFGHYRKPQHPSLFDQGAA